MSHDIKVVLIAQIVSKGSDEPVQAFMLQATLLFAHKKYGLDIMLNLFIRKTSTLANSEEPDEMLHNATNFIRINTAQR